MICFDDGHANEFNTLLVTDWFAHTPPEVLAKVKWRIDVTGKSLAKAYPAGVKIAFGTDAGVSKHGRNADEFELMVKHGMPASAGAGSQADSWLSAQANTVIASASTASSDSVIRRRSVGWPRSSPVKITLISGERRVGVHVGVRQQP